MAGHIATLTQAFVSGPTGEAGGPGKFGDVGQTVVSLSKKGKEMASSVGSKGVLLASGVLLTSGALLMGAGAVLLAGQVFRGGAKDD